jgi:hypothetical protein
MTAVTPPRVANGSTLLAGVVRRGCCGAAMIWNAGKGVAACRGIRMLMNRLDEIVVGEVAKDPSLGERLIGLEARRDELAKEAADLQRHLATGEPQITHDKIDRFARRLRDKPCDGPPESRQAGSRLVMGEVTLTEDEIRISGSKAVLVRCASQEELLAAPAVLSFVRKQRAALDKNANTYVIEVVT